jgi:hypothetical protein
MTIDKEVLTAALLGYEAERAKIERKMLDIRALLGIRPPGRPKSDAPAAASVPAKRQVSAAGRKRMAAAQRKRWAAVKKAKNVPA